MNKVPTAEITQSTTNKCLLKMSGRVIYYPGITLESLTDTFLRKKSYYRNKEVIDLRSISSIKSLLFCLGINLSDAC